MRRARLLGAAALGAVALVLLATFGQGAPSDAVQQPQITRLFIPAIKLACLERAGLEGRGRDLGYVFTPDGALHTLDTGDGSVAGLPRQRLLTLNNCLAEYPIETQIAPRDQYTRNVLYDYNVNVLKPCLEARVDELPPLPSRADFVVRLYVWDPYRALAPGRELGELLELSATCPALPGYLADPGPD